MKKIVLIFLVLIIFLPLNCKEEKNSEFAVFPQFAYSQETGFWGGLITYYRYQIDQDPELKNHLDMMTMYTQKKQLQIRFFPKFNLTNLNSELNIDTSFMKWPSEFYGVENTDPEAEMYKFTPEIFEFELDWKYDLKPNWFLHFYSDQLHSVIIKRENSVLMTDLPGNEENILSGIGSGISYDSRDSEDYSTKGIFANLKLHSYSSWLGSDYDYEKLTLDLREFISINRNHVFAFQQYFSYRSDTTPFYRLFKLGEYVRAFNNELFLNNHGIAFRAEYRFFPFTGKIGQRIGFATFFDTGQGMQNLEDLNFSKFRCSFGAGLRISIFVQDRFNLRFDYGRCTTNSSVDIGGGETFG
ncbi:MAG: BamA/TamA family outer membrane protein [Candidatus Cloacimonetes bacterium]|nr:BamA/TamA family outer membrane protein [Candidatus Cloacimonadota bacterium]MCF7813475.1 BamA/TamA family outer membrane protein [Candidatus Cloacimonadota bacterium]MCF7869177.1 BamA/TamA family outer membrane protein [Candidatus Cloacimonadota bacterium]MCF7883389.1 BamA/TamA family outer membrane protein [Candidatus Cloacimonadota bacterium]